MPLRIAVFCACAGIMGGLLRGADNAPQVFDPTAGPDDVRLHDLHDVDHPYLFTPHFKDKSAWERHARAIREQVLVAEGLWPMPPKTPLNPVIHGNIDRDDYTIEKVFFASYPGHYVSGNLYRPKNKTGRLPGVLCPHGHWPDGRFYERSDDEARRQIDEGAEKTMQGAKYPLQARCAMLARMGCVVFHYDMVGYADSKPIEHRTGFTDAQAVLRLQSFMGLQTWNSIRALDFLASLPDVDASRLAVTGASGGGTQTFILAAADDRPAVIFPAVMVGEEMQGGCVCENAPLLRVRTNNVEIAATFAPKPLGMTGANDWTRAIEFKGLPELKAIYKLFGAENEVTAKHFSFEHNYNQVSREMMYNWFNDHLKLRWPSPVVEKPFTPVLPRELSVYDDEHPRPSDAYDARMLRQYLTQTSDKQLHDLAEQRPSEYRHILATALSVMINDHFPSAAEVTVSRSSGPQPIEGATMETGALGRRNSGEAVPFISLVPRDWDGSIVVWAHPSGKSTLFDEAGKPSADVRRLLERKAAVVSADLFLSGEFHQGGGQGQDAGDYEKQHYSAFFNGYNRSVAANRVHDLLTVLGYVRHWKGTKSLDLLASDQAGPVALIARAMAGTNVRRAAIDVAGFDFDKITDDHNPLLLPGALKYGGIRGFARLCTSGQTLLSGMRPGEGADHIDDPRQLTVRESKSETGELLEWVTR